MSDEESLFSEPSQLPVLRRHNAIYHVDDDTISDISLDGEIFNELLFDEFDEFDEFYSINELRIQLFDEFYDETDIESDLESE